MNKIPEEWPAEKMVCAEDEFTTPPAQEGESELLRTIDERDRCEEWADKLADAIARKLGIEIGEHSNLNCPWENALGAIAAPAQEFEPVYQIYLAFDKWKDVDQHIYDALTLPKRIVYTHPQPDGLRKAAEEAARQLEGLSGWPKLRDLGKNLRAALEKGQA